MSVIPLLEEVLPPPRSCMFSAGALRWGIFPCHTNGGALGRRLNAEMRTTRRSRSGERDGTGASARKKGRLFACCPGGPQASLRVGRRRHARTFRVSPKTRPAGRNSRTPGGVARRGVWVMERVGSLFHPIQSQILDLIFGARDALLTEAEGAPGAALGIRAIALKS